MNWFTGKSVLVTGAASGIGAMTAQRFAAEGASVCIADRDEAGLARTAATIRAAGGRAEPLQADVSSADDNRAMVQKAIESFGRLDAVHLNAGILGSMNGFGDEDLETFDRILRVNLYGCFHGLKAALPRIAEGGAVVVTASIAGFLGLAENPAYSASKHGILGLVRSSARAFGERGARVNAICPGGVETPMGGVMEAAPMVAPEAMKHPAWRGSVTAQHVAELALFLASPRSAGMNGSTVTVDAGFTAALAY